MLGFHLAYQARFDDAAEVQHRAMIRLGLERHICDGWVEAPAEEVIAVIQSVTAPTNSH